MHQVPWNKIILEEFISQALLTEDEEMIIRTRVAGWSRIQQAEKLGMSVSTVDRILSGIWEKYNMVQRYDPILPPLQSTNTGIGVNGI